MGAEILLDNIILYIYVPLCTLYVHYMYIICTLLVHYMYIIYISCKSIYLIIYYILCIYIYMYKPSANRDQPVDP